MNLVGDELGIQALHAMKEANREYLRFLMQEARTVHERQVDFKAADGTKFRLSYVDAEGRFVVSRP